MRVLIVSTGERTGGAAVAASRLMMALNNNGVKARMLVRDKQTNAVTVMGLGHTLRRQWSFLWERLVIWCHLRFRREHLFDIDIANSGCDITRLREFREADVIHLHWVNQGMLSLGSIQKILRSGKPVVWTMHDMWPATAICHLTLGCRYFTSRCHHCKYLPGKGGASDLASTVWKHKQRLYENSAISFVACSRWLEGEARASQLLRGLKVTSIPNTIDTHQFAPISRQEVRQRLGLPIDRRLILFVSQRVTNPYKGMEYLIEACHLLKDIPRLGVAILGGHAEEVSVSLPLETYPLGYVSDERRIIDVYNAADVFVLPSLSENLPNTIMEAMACGVPCVGFRVGGIPEEIDHLKTGYVADYRNADDLARGIRWILTEADPEALSRAAVAKVAQNYSQQSVAMRYIEVYHEVIALKHYKL